jgi:hypothetical protein
VVENSFDQGRAIERRSWKLLEPYFRQFGIGYQRVDYRLYRGDYRLTLPNGQRPYLELKAEIEDRYGNLFIERWSNYEITDGWLVSSRADIVLYHFLRCGSLYIFSLGQLKDSLMAKDLAGTTYGERTYPLKQQRKYEQHNDTRGWPVPIRHIFRLTYGGRAKIAAENP